MLVYEIYISPVPWPTAMFNLKSECTRYETPVQYRERILSHYIAYFTQFISFISSSVIQVSLWAYLHKLVPNSDKTFYGYILGTEAFGQMIYSTLIGYLSAKFKSTRMLFIINLLFEVVSILIHVSLENIQHQHRKYWMLLSRFLGGIASVNMTLAGIHVTLTTLVSERRNKLSLIGVMFGIGMAFTSVIQLMTIHFGDTGFWLIPNILMINMYTSTSWFLIAMCIFNIILFHPAIFKEHVMSQNDEVQPESQQYKTRNYKFAAMLLIGMYFAATAHHTFLIFIGSPVVMDIFAADRITAVTWCSYINLGNAAIASLVTISLDKLCRLFTERKVLASYMFLVILGRFAFYPLSTDLVRTYDSETYLQNVTASYQGCPSKQDWCKTERQLSFIQYVVAMTLETGGYCVAYILLMSTLTKVLEQPKQAYWLGIYGTIGGLSRFISPIIISYLYTSYGLTITALLTGFEYTIVVALFLIGLKYCINNGESKDAEGFSKHCKTILLEDVNPNK